MERSLSRSGGYRILRKARLSAMPVFLGMIDLARIYFLHGAGEIRHTLDGLGGKYGIDGANATAFAGDTPFEQGNQSLRNYSRRPST